MVSTPNKHSITRPQATHSGLSPNKDFNQTDNSPSKSTLKNPLPKNGPIRATPITTKRAQFVKKQFGLRDETNVRVSNAKQNDLESKVDDTDDTMTNLRKSFAGIFGELWAACYRAYWKKKEILEYPCLFKDVIKMNKTRKNIMIVTWAILFFILFAKYLYE